MFTERNHARPILPVSCNKTETSHISQPKHLHCFYHFIFCLSKINKIISSYFGTNIRVHVALNMKWVQNIWPDFFLYTTVAYCFNSCTFLALLTSKDRWFVIHNLTPVRLTSLPSPLPAPKPSSLCRDKALLFSAHKSSRHGHFMLSFG